MPDDDSERLLNEIGTVLTASVNRSPNSILLYAEVESNTAEICIFELQGSAIMFKIDPEPLFDLLLDLWELAPDNRRWAAIEYFLNGDRFKARYSYPDDPDWSNDDNRREAVVRRYLGDAPIVYPPWRAGPEGLTFKL